MIVVTLEDNRECIGLALSGRGPLIGIEDHENEFVASLRVEPLREHYGAILMRALGSVRVAGLQVYLVLA